MRSHLQSGLTNVNHNYFEFRHVHPISLAVSYALKKNGLPFVFASDALTVLKPKVLLEELKKSDILQVEHPWQFEYVYRKKPVGTPVIFVAHNVEAKLFQGMLCSRPIPGRKLLEIIDKKERFAIRHADLIICMSEDDKNQLTDRCEECKTKIHVVPNGVDASFFTPATLDERNYWKSKMGLANRKVILFTGSLHQPNIEAIRNIQKISDEIENKDIVFLVAGSAGKSFQSKRNMLFTGYVDDIAQYFKAADIALNPMTSGSGTNLKVLEYLASGIPVITTSIGARGIDLRHDKDVIISGIESFTEWIYRLLTDECLCEKLRTNGRKLAEARYSWENIAKCQMKLYNSLLH